jgi:hypothetical protein
MQTSYVKRLSQKMPAACKAVVLYFMGQLISELMSISTSVWKKNYNVELKNGFARAVLRVDRNHHRVERKACNS